ncbi:hypothetical protein LCGC14_0815040 [marine sediment metagenome]|uniref:DUF4430 domain-containing protein n=1 Tax=marine sediment metagenome TaxID=412755 RepID=A0A0F9S5G8_9ZZZZ|nr:MAG: hypothetical protein Lokiarch_03930 [Candidatus Lokiarchaeum sp. GC14_75]
MKSTKKILIIVGLLGLVQLFSQGIIPAVKANTNIPTPYYQDLDINGTYVYNVTTFGTEAGWYNFTPWPNSYEGQWKTNPGGQIKINFTGFYAKDSNDWGSIFGDPIPWLDIEILENDPGVLKPNFTLNNRSNSEIARALTLGFNYFQSGFLIPTENFTQIKNIAINQSDPGGLYDIIGDVRVEETYNFIFIGFDQVGDGQETYLIYDKWTGLLVWAKTSYLGYILEIQSLNFTLDYSSSFTYDVNDFGGKSSWYNFTVGLEGYWQTNIGGEIIVNFTGFYNKDPNDWGSVFASPIAWFDIEIVENSSGFLTSNFTIANRSNSEIAWALTLGYNNYQPGFLISIMNNLTEVKKLALQEATGYVTGIVNIEETDLALKISFDQTGGGQKTLLIYEKWTGLLLWANTSIGNYSLNIVIEGYELWVSVEDTNINKTNPFLTYLPYLIIVTISLFSIVSLFGASKINTTIKHYNKYFLIAIIATASFTSFFVFSSSINVSEVNQSQKVARNLTLIVDYGNGTIKTEGNFELTDYNTTAFDALAKWCNVEYSDFGGMGILVEDIDGIKGNWRYSIDDDFPGVSSDKYNLKDGNIIKWVFG